MPFISFRDLQTAADVLTWTTQLEDKWPERTIVVKHISQQVNALPFPAPHIVELGPGHGRLAESLLLAGPHLTYTGIDSSEPLLRFAQDRLAPFEARATLLQADLKANAWLDQLSGDIQAIVSMQSLHDLGDEDQVNRIYRLAETLLVPGGLFLNADLVVPPDQDNPNNPGRRSIPRHLELLRSHGYAGVACTLKVGEFGCFVAFKTKA